MNQNEPKAEGDCETHAGKRKLREVVVHGDVK